MDNVARQRLEVLGSDNPQATTVAATQTVRVTFVWDSQLKEMVFARKERLEAFVARIRIARVNDASLAFVKRSKLQADRAKETSNAHQGFALAIQTSIGVFV